MIITQIHLKELLEYNPETGFWRWKKCVGNRKTGWFNGSRMANGYYCLRLENTTYYAHKLAWLYVHGTEPEIVDHIDNIKSNNKLSNLRSATKSQNMMNSRTRIDNVSGHRGISWDKSTEQYHAFINLNGRRYHKYYDDLEQAISWRNKMAEKLHGEFRATEPPLRALSGGETFENPPVEDTV